MSRPVITVDGLASSGKSSLARLLAERLQFAHLNSGLLYRGIAWLALSAGVSPDDEAAVANLVRVHRVALIETSDRVSVLSVDGNQVDGQVLQGPKVSDATSRLAVFASIRAALLPLQREAYPGRGVVAEGRDMGTVVFPDAALKFFVVADESVRIQRRLVQLGLTAGVDNRLKRDVEIEITERDTRDRERSLAPTVAAQDAVTIDNSSDSLTEVVERMYTAALSRGLARP